MPDPPSLAAATKGPSGSGDRLSTGQDGRAADLQGISARASRGKLTCLATSPIRPQFLASPIFEWTNGKLPPPSRVPKLSDGTLVPPLPQSGMGFPSIPGVTYTGLKTTRYLLDYGPDYYTTGIPTVNPPLITPPYEDNPLNGPIYPSFVPKTDSDGNDIAGVRLPDVTVPLATYTGWALRSGPQANDGCESSGQYIPFAGPRSNASPPAIRVRRSRSANRRSVSTTAR